MGLQSQLNDVSSDSIPLLLLALIARCVSYLRSVIWGLFHSLGLSRFDPDRAVDDGFLAAVGSGLTGLIVLADQLNLNRVFSYEYAGGRNGGSDSGLVGRPDCIVCLSALRDGDQVRRLACRHVFHKECFDGWLHHLKFTCPLCRSPQVREERVALTGRRVGGDLLAWFSVR